jgi:hypothetical protein
MPVKRRLLSEEITYSQAKEKETNILHQLTYWSQRVKFYNYVLIIFRMAWGGADTYGRWASHMGA